MSDYISPADEDFFGAIGRLTISWAQLEFGLDLMVATIHAHLDGDKIEPTMPRALQRKLNYLRIAFDTLQPLDKWNDDFKTLADNIEDAAHARHDMIHGFIIEHSINDDGSVEAKMIRLLRKRNLIAERHFVATAKNILEAAVSSGKLGRQSLDLATELTAKFSRK